MTWRSFLVGFLAGATLFFAANLMAVHYHSDAGLLEGLGILNSVQDDVRRIGFPFEFLEAGGFSYRHVFNSSALYADILIGIGTSFVCGIVFLIFQRFRSKDTR